jgi:integrase
MKKKSTRQLLEKIANVPCLYRHINGTYYGIKKLNGKTKEHSLQTADRKTADRKLAEWIRGLDKLDSAAGKTTLAQLIEKFVAMRQGKPPKTKATDASIIKRFKADWKHILDIQVKDVKPSQLSEWLAKIEGGMKNTTYNRYSGVLKSMFDIAVNDRTMARVKTFKRPQKPERHCPTKEQFEAIVNDIRAQRFNADAEDSADFVEFMGLAGLGQAETRSLTFGDIDWTAGFMNIKRQKTSQRFRVPIFPWLKSFLQKMKDKQGGQTTADTKVFKILDAKKALNGACARLGLRHFSQRSIRVYFIKRLMQAGVNPKLIAEYQGHQDGGKLIMSVYTEAFSQSDADYVKAELAKVK